MSQSAHRYSRARGRTWTLATLMRGPDYRLWWNQVDRRWEVSIIGTEEPLRTRPGLTEPREATGPERPAARTREEPPAPTESPAPASRPAPWPAP